MAFNDGSKRRQNPEKNIVMILTAMKTSYLTKKYVLERKHIR
jgi:hypothetical protein